MLSKLRILSLSLLPALLVVAGCQVNNINLQPLMDASSKSGDLFEKTLEEEVELGANVSQVLLKDAALYNVRDVQRYVSKVGMWVAQHTGHSDVPWTFAVLRDDSFNAFATPGGYIYLTTGTLSQLDDEAELAAVLAHEIAHVVRKHHLIAIQKEARVGMALDLARFARESSREEGGSRGMIFGDHTPEGQFVNSLQDIYSNGLAREDELEADSMGMVIAARAGYDPMVYIKVLQKIDAQQHSGAFWEKYMKRHPSAEERLAALTRTAEALSGIQGKALPQRYRQQLR